MKKYIIVALIIVFLSVTVIVGAQTFGDGIRGRIPTPPSEVHPQYFVFAKIGNIEGEVKDNNHNKWIDVLSYEFGAEEGVDEPTGLPTGIRIHSPLVIKKSVDKASPLLARAVAGGSFFDVFIEIVGEHGPYMNYSMSDVRISSYSVVGIPSLGEPKPTEIITLIFEHVEFVYIEYDQKGKIISIVESEWDGVAT
jgi:type VI secretion system secreted protein Hcp